MTTCQRCSVLYEDANLCFGCQRKLYETLGMAAVMARQLQVTVTRQSKTAPPREGGKSTETPLPFDDDAAEAAWILGQTLDAWAVEIRTPAELFHCTDFSHEGVAKWLRERVPRLAQLSTAGQCFDEIHQAVTLALRTVDRPPTFLYLGHCVCGRELFGDPAVPSLECTRCGTDHDTNKRRVQNQQRARDLIVTADEAVEYLQDVFGIRLRVTRIRNWGSRGRIGRVLLTDGQYVYRFGDILDRVRETPAGLIGLGDTKLG